MANSKAISSLKSLIVRNRQLSSYAKSIYYALPTTVRSWFEIHDYRTQIELKLKPLVRYGEDFFFIKIGANDGVKRDPIAYFIRHYGWTGIMVEPVGYLFKELKSNYRKYPQIKFENTAIADVDGFKKFFYIQEKQPGDDVPVWYNGINSFRLDVVLKHKSSFPGIEDYLVEEEVPCMSFPSFLRKHQVQKIDLLHIDTEGYDYEVVKQVDFSLCQPAIILYENKHLEMDDRNACATLLAEKGYTLIDLEGDTLAYREL